jgi:hypothetical protein
VIIAAGYDTRAYRLSKPGVRFYEIDLPHASKHKQELVRKLLPAHKVRGTTGCGMPAQPATWGQQSAVWAPGLRVGARRAWALLLVSWVWDRPGLPSSALLA